MYWWDGALERTEEWLVLLKLPADRYDELAAFITERHSYDEPEIIALPIVAGSTAYLNWMREETRSVGPAQGALGRPVQVPTCPDWNAGQLLRHLGGAQRWAAGITARAARSSTR